jgi:predicted regulator of Ras-like GTPase activity (Roadblock/LC7/MglB family)
MSVEADLAAAGGDAAEKLMRLHPSRLMFDAHVGIVLLLPIGDDGAIPMQLRSFTGVGDETVERLDTAVSLRSALVICVRSHSLAAPKVKFTVSM